MRLRLSALLLLAVWGRAIFVRACLLGLQSGARVGREEQGADVEAAVEVVGRASDELGEARRRIVHAA